MEDYSAAKDRRKPEDIRDQQRINERIIENTN